jgi:ATP-dependent helicase Lhr and Lhr-like helicase
LATVRTVIVDEIHAMAPNKRGSHLAVSLERMAPLLRSSAAAYRPVRHAESIQDVARFLTGAGVGVGPDCAIVDSGHRRERDLALEVPDSPLDAIMSAEVWDQVYGEDTAAAH